MSPIFADRRQRVDAVTRTRHVGGEPCACDGYEPAPNRCRSVPVASLHLEVHYRVDLAAEPGPVSELCGALVDLGFGTSARVLEYERDRAAVDVDVRDLMAVHAALVQKGCARGPASPRIRRGGGGPSTTPRSATDHQPAAAGSRPTDATVHELPDARRPCRSGDSGGFEAQLRSELDESEAPGECSGAGRSCSPLRKESLVDRLADR